MMVTISRGTMVNHDCNGQYLKCYTEREMATTFPTQSTTRTRLDMGFDSLQTYKCSVARPGRLAVLRPTQPTSVTYRALVDSQSCCHRLSRRSSSRFRQTNNFAPLISHNCASNGLCVCY